jgi:hypothetical protein
MLSLRYYIDELDEMTIDTTRIKGIAYQQNNPTHLHYLAEGITHVNLVA